MLEYSSSRTARKTGRRRFLAVSFWIPFPVVYIHIKIEETLAWQVFVDFSILLFRAGTAVQRKERGETRVNRARGLALRSLLQKLTSSGQARLRSSFPVLDGAPVASASRFR